MDISNLLLKDLSETWGVHYHYLLSWTFKEDSTFSPSFGFEQVIVISITMLLLLLSRFSHV